MLSTNLFFFFFFFFFLWGVEGGGGGGGVWGNIYDLMSSHYCPIYNSTIQVPGNCQLIKFPLKLQIMIHAYKSQLLDHSPVKIHIVHNLANLVYICQLGFSNSLAISLKKV